MNERPKLANPVLDAIGHLIARADSWINPLTSFGTSRDRTTGAYFQIDAAIPDDELAGLFHGDDMARKIVSIVPREALRQGFKLTGEDTEGVKKVGDKAKALDVRNKVIEGWTWGRCLGGSLLLIGADDGAEDVTLPLNEETIRSLTFLTVYDKRRAFPSRYYETKGHPKFGQPEVYTLNGIEGGTSFVHESRCIVFRGAMTGDRERRQMQSWDYSVLQHCYKALRQFHANTNAAELLITDASQSVFKMRGLIAALASPGGKANLETRAALLDSTRSIARSVMIDAEGGEEYTKIPTQFAGVADMLDRSANRLAAASEIPVTILMGQAPAGLAATGDADVRTFYDRIRSEQENTVRPHLEKLIRLIRKAERVASPVGLAFEPLWQESPKERAERRKLVADADAIYIDREVYTPDECAESRFGGEAWSDETKLDLSLRKPPIAPLAGTGPAKPPTAPQGAPQTPPGPPAPANPPAAPKPVG